METITLSTEMMAVLAILAFTIYLFVSEIVRVDVAAILVMVIIGLTGLIPGYDGLIPAKDLFNGFASNAVISIIAVMIIGAGLDKTGVMAIVATKILQFGGNTESRIITILSSTVGIISSFMQNVGAAALFLPVANRISRRTHIPLSHLLMPIGFCAILGGTVTMVGSSPLILLNDLILTSNKSLEAQGLVPMDTFGLFAVTPIGLALIATGILYFVIFARVLLPDAKQKTVHSNSTNEYFEKLYGITGSIYEMQVTLESDLAGLRLLELEEKNLSIKILAIKNADEIDIAPGRDAEIWVGTELAVMANEASATAFAKQHKLEVRSSLEEFNEALSVTSSGISEVVIHPNSKLIGQSIHEIKIRKRYGISVLAIHRNNQTISTDLRHIKFQSGDTLVVHSTWKDLGKLAKDRNFVIATDFPHDETRPHKLYYGLFFFAVALGLVLFSDLKLSVALLTGAVGMIVTGVIEIDEAYKAVDWKTVFLLASLIPLGLAVETTGTAAWIAHHTLKILDWAPIWGIQLAIGVLATFFTLVMSNVGATVLLVPLAVNIAVGTGANPAVFALTVGLATSNSFIIPTHQVNALIMGPAGYKVTDFIRAGGIMTGLFLVVIMVMLNIIF